LKSLVAVIHKNKRNAAGNSEAVVQTEPCSTGSFRGLRIYSYSCMAS